MYADNDRARKLRICISRVRRRVLVVKSNSARGLRIFRSLDLIQERTDTACVPGIIAPLSTLRFSRAYAGGLRTASDLDTRKNSYLHRGLPTNSRVTWAKTAVSRLQGLTSSGRALLYTMRAPGLRRLVRPEDRNAQTSI